MGGGGGEESEDNSSVIWLETVVGGLVKVISACQVFLRTQL